MQRIKVKYDVSSGGVLLTRCPLKGVLVGSVFCMRCKSYESKNRNEQFVVCRNKSKD